MAIIKLDGGYNALPISYKRGNPIPLDTTAVWYDKAKLIEYAKTGVTAYVGQVLTLVDSTNNTATAYVIANTAGDLEPIGTAPIGDAKSIVVAEDGTVSLKGVASLVFERDIVGEDGEPTGEKENVQYQPLMTKDGLVWVEPSKTTVEGLATLIEALTQRVTGLEGKVGKAAEGEAEATGLYKLIADETARATEAEGALEDRIETLEGKEDKDTTYSVKEGEKVLSLDGTVFGTTLKIQKATHDDKTWVQLLGINDELVSEFDAAEFVADGFLTNAEYDADTRELVFTWNTDAGVGVDRVPVGDLVDTYTAGNGITIENNVVSAKVDATDKYLTVDGTGIHTKGIDDAIAAAEGRAATDAQGKANAAQSAAEATASADATAKANAVRNYVGEFTTGEDKYKDLDTVVAYINKKAEETLAAAQGGSSETAASVKQQLDNYKTENDIKVNANTTKLATIEEGAQVNVIESVVAKEGAKITATKEGKTVTIDDSALVTLINNAQAKAEEGVTAAGNAQTTADGAASKAQANETAIGTINTTIAGHTSTIGDHGTRIAAAEGTITEHTGKLTTLEGQVANKADQTTVDGLAGTVGKNTGDITALTARVAANETALTNVYTKTETDSAIKAITGTPAEGKTIVKMIEDLAAEAYDDTEVRGLISANTTAIENITKAETGAIAVAKAEALKAVSDLENGAVKTNTEAITKLNGDVNTEGSVDYKVAQEVAKILNDSDPSDIDTLNEIAAWITNDTTGAAKMNADIAANTAAIKTINDTTIPAAIKAAKDYTDAQITALDLANTYEAKGAAETALTDAKKYVDDNFKVKDVDGTSIELDENGKASVKAVSTDLLTQGTMTLILNGGSASK